MTLHARRMAAAFALWVTVVIGVLVIAGCTGGGRAGGQPRSYALNSSSDFLVLRPIEAADASTGDDIELSWLDWEFSRNNPIVNADAPPPWRPPAVGEVRTHQRLWTINGRPREYTLTSFRSWQGRDR